MHAPTPLSVACSIPVWSVLPLLSLLRPPPPATLLPLCGRPDHRHDGLPDSLGQGGPSVNYGLQARLYRGGSCIDCTGFCTALFGKPCFPRGIRPLF